MDDDAIFPLHWVNFGELNDVSVEMTAYMPYYPDSVPMMLHPCAMFEFEVENLESDSATVALAFQIETPVAPVAIPDTGFTANDTSLELCLSGIFPEGTGDLSYGNDDGFFTDGLCDNNLSGTTNRLALRVYLASAETKRLRFVLSWYQPDELDHYQYTNYWNDAKEVSVSALSNFDTFKNKSEELVSRMRNSNLPEWLVDQTLNSLVNLVNNSVYFRDGRYCHTEGQWSPEGTMDQMWHARQIYTMINPQLAWQELEWWARTQHFDNYIGQIHHDFGTNFNYVGWDETEHSDYRAINEWVDLNCGFIISVYEAFIATADMDELTYFLDPYVKRAGQRILDQVELYESSEYPYTFSNSLSTYDAGGNSQAYNTGLSVVTYQIMIYLAEIMGEPDTEIPYQAALDTVIVNFESRWLDNTYPTGNYCESVLGGPWIANFLKMGPFWEKQKLNGLYNTIVNYYDPLNRGIGNSSYSEWQPYLVGHLGGFSLQIGKYNMWRALQKDMYDR
ncbi:MAG: GH116 family glycosyl hydrolase, partial [candidate division WOR-3 bacterium]